MSTKVGTSESPTQKADDVRPPFDGPHDPKAKKQKKDDGASDDAAYRVEINRDPAVLKAKARSLLNNPKIDPEQRRVLKEILGPEEKKKA